MKEIFICTFLVWLTAGCTPSDPLGFNYRTQTRVQGAVDIAAEERKAEEAKAQALVDAEIARQAGLSQRNSLIMMAIPPTLLVVGLVVGVLLWLNWRGRIAFERERQHALGVPPLPPPLPNRVVALYKEKGCEIVLHDGDWWPVHKDSGKMLPNPARKVLEVAKCR